MIVPIVLNKLNRSHNSARMYESPADYESPGLVKLKTLRAVEIFGGKNTKLGLTLSLTVTFACTKRPSYIIVFLDDIADTNLQ